MYCGKGMEAAKCINMLLYLFFMMNKWIEFFFKKKNKIDLFHYFVLMQTVGLSSSPS